MVAPIAPTTPPVDPDAVEAAAKILGASRRPLIVVGGGAQDAATEVRLLAEMLEAPVVSYRRGRGVLPSSHRLAVPFPVGQRLWATADVAFGIGTRLYPQQSQWGTDEALQMRRVGFSGQQDMDRDRTIRVRQECRDIRDIFDAPRVIWQNETGLGGVYFGPKLIGRPDGAIDAMALLYRDRDRVIAAARETRRDRELDGPNTTRGVDDVRADLLVVDPDHQLRRVRENGHGR